MRRRLFVFGSIFGLLLSIVGVQPAYAVSQTVRSTPLDNGVVTSTYGWNSYADEEDQLVTYWHSGIDYDVPSEIGVDMTNSVVAVGDGVVVDSPFHDGCLRQSGGLSNTCGGGFGNHVVLKHTLADGTHVYSSYSHLDTVDVLKGDCVPEGGNIGELGHTGKSTAEHLHFEMHTTSSLNGHSQSTTALDPGGYLGTEKFEQLSNCGGGSYGNHDLLALGGGGNLDAKFNLLTIGWATDIMGTRVDTAAGETVVDYQVDDGKIGVLTSTGELYVRDAGSAFVHVNPSKPARKFDIDGNNVAIVSNGYGVYVKVDSNWSPLLMTGNPDTQLDDNQLYVRKSDTTLLARNINNWNQGWVTVLGSGAASFKAENNVLLVHTTGGSIHAKPNGYGSGWIYNLMQHRVSESETVVDYQIEGSRIGVLTSNGELYVRESLNSAFVDLGSSSTSMISEFDLSPDALAAVWEGALVVKMGSLTQGWSSGLWTNPYDFQVADDRVVVLTHSGGSLKGKYHDKLNQAWLGLGSGYASFVLEAG